MQAPGWCHFPPVFSTEPSRIENFTQLATAILPLLLSYISTNYIIRRRKHQCITSPTYEVEFISPARYCPTSR